MADWRHARIAKAIAADEHALRDQVFKHRIIAVRDLRWSLDCAVRNKRCAIEVLPNPFKLRLPKTEIPFGLQVEEYHTLVNPAEYEIAAKSV